MNLKLLRLFLLVFFLPLFQSADAQCEYTLEMFDSDGDGWNGASLTISVGTTVYTFSLNGIFDDGIDSTLTFPVNTGQQITMSWAPGFFDDEVSFVIYDYEGNVVYEDAFPNSGPLFSGIAFCPSCLKPANVKIENVYDTYAKLRWSPGNTAPALGWWVIYGPKDFVLSSGVGDSVYVTTPKVTLQGLAKKTFYDFYVLEQCDSTDISIGNGPYTFETYFSNDVGISNVLTPESGCDLGVETVTVVMSNFGSNPQSLIPFRFSVNGVDAGVPQPQDGFYTGVLGKDSSDVIEFETFYDFSEPGEYLIKVYTQMNGDEDFSNDTFYYYIVNRLVTPYAQDFETWSGGWYPDTSGNASSWEFGPPKGLVITEAASGKNAWVTNLDGDYNDAELSYLNSPCFDFSDLTEDPVLEFSINYDTELEYDGGYLEVSTNDGQDWDKLGTIDEGLNWYNFFNTNTGLGDVWAGNSGGWQTARLRLLNMAGLSNVRLRYVFASDPIVTFEGLAIDDIRIYVPLADDMAGLSVKSDGEAVECGLQSDLITFTFSNFGTQPQSFFDVAYSVNGGPPVIENVTATVQPDEQFTYTFTTPFDSRDGLFDVKCWTSLLDEQFLANDTAYYTVSHLPKPVPFQENFESQTIPNDWTVTGFPFITSGTGNTSYVLEVNIWSGNPTIMYELPRYGMISDNDTLTFDYRLTDFATGGTVPTVLAGGTKIDVQVSTDCQNYQTIYTINAASHVPSILMKTIKVGLGAYSGKSISIRFRSAWTTGDFYFDLDNINLRACAADMNLTPTVVPSTTGQNGAATVNVGLGNPPYTYLWSNGATTKTVMNLPIGPITVTVTDALGCTDDLTINVGATATAEIEGLTRLSIQPNPTSGQSWLYVSFDEPVDLHIELINLFGQRVWEMHNPNATEINELLDLSGHSDGLYLVRLTADGKVLTKKLILAGR